MVDTVPPNTVVESAVTKQDFEGNPVAAVVPVKSAWLSKINWTQAGAASSALIIAAGLDIPTDKKAAVLATLTIVSNVLTWIMRTWFNDSVSASSIAK